MSGQPNYEVFLSFRGPDTRRDFAGFLYSMLTDVGICVFRDDKELESGKEIHPQLMGAILQSKISIPVISKEFASSKSCLMELERMVECKKSKNHIIIPVFYYVKPSDVSNCRGPFEGAFAEHRKRGRDAEFISHYMSILGCIGNLKGHHLHEEIGVNHVEVTKQIVRQVQQKLEKKDLIVPEQLVGIDPHVQEIMAKLKFDYRNGQWVKIGDTSVKVLGIYGIPGVGKTVLAKCVYNRLHHLYDACSFLEEIQGENKNHGTVSLQNRLISDLHNTNAPNYNRHDNALAYIQRRFRNKEVLVLLDDVKDHKQLSALVGKLDWFGPGSTVIVTSQRHDVLKKVNGAESYVLRTMKQDKALTLFCKHAFETDSPLEEFKELAKNIVAATDGLPLALENVGQSLFQEKKRKVWTETLIALNEAPDKSVRAAFSKSYNTLEENEQKIFLDIACFINGKDKRIPYYMWNNCKFSPSRSIISLKAMSLVEIGEDKEICMRGILTTFGREIVKNESKNVPCERSRLCNHKEALDVLIGRKGTEKVEALRLEFGDGTVGNICFKCDHFKGLQNLRFLKLDQADIGGPFGDHFSSLRWLDWQWCPKIFYDQSLNLNVQNLVILDLSWSQVHKDWSGWELLVEARKLKVLKLTGCVQLTATPEFPPSMELERLILEGCSNLAVVDPSFGNLKKLVSLNMKGCGLLRELPDLGPMRDLEELVIDQTSISRINFQKDSMVKLKTLSARDCKHLTDISDLIMSLKSLKYLNLDGSGIHTVHSIGLLQKLKKLSLKNCQRLFYLPDGIEKLTSLQFLDLSNSRIYTLPKSIGSLEELKKLSLKNCQHLFYLQDGIEKLTSLQFLDLSNSRISTLPESIGSLEELKKLSLKNCQHLFYLPDGIEKLTSLQFLDLSNSRISTLPESIGSLEKLNTLDLNNCRGLSNLSYGIGNLRSLQFLDLSDSGIQTLPESIGSLEELNTLDLNYCSSLSNLPDGIGKLRSLQFLDLSDTLIGELPPSVKDLKAMKVLKMSSTPIREFPEAILNLEKLEEIDFSLCWSLEGRIPDDIWRLTSLAVLKLSDTRISGLPASISRLSHLRKLDTFRCHNLQNPPESPSSSIKVIPDVGK